MVIKHKTKEYDYDTAIASDTAYPARYFSKQISQNQRTFSTTLLVNVAIDAQYTQYSKLRRALSVNMLAPVKRSIEYLLRLAVGSDHQT